jgi:hypothetical protein
MLQSPLLSFAFLLSVIGSLLIILICLLELFGWFFKGYSMFKLLDSSLISESL